LRLEERSGEKFQIVLLRGFHIFKFGESDDGNDRVLSQWVPENV